MGARELQCVCCNVCAHVCVYVLNVGLWGVSITRYVNTIQPFPASRFTHA